MKQAQDPIGWLTNDHDEILRRQRRGETEFFFIENLEPSQSYYGTFLIKSRKGTCYQVEIRSLIERVNSCSCPDYHVNGLGTCKHIEAVLADHQKKHGHQIYEESSKSSWIEIFVKNGSQMAVQWPDKPDPSARALVAPYFSLSGDLLVDGQILLEKIKQANIDPNALRLSTHIDHLLAHQSDRARKQQAKINYLLSLANGRKPFEFLNVKLPLYQEEGALHLAFNERAILADEIGLGNNLQAIAACSLLRQLKGIQRVLVIAPSTLITDWEEQIARFTVFLSVVIRGSSRYRARLYQKPSFFYLISYEQVQRDFSLIQTTLAPDVIILDEAQRIKDWRSRTAWAVKQLKSPYVFVLSNTPLNRCIEEIYSIIQVVDPAILGPLFRFNREYYELDEFGKPVGTKNLDKLQQRLRPVMMRRLKTEVEGKT